jgi:small-conductance mechanosensitive channel
MLNNLKKLLNASPAPLVTNEHPAGAEAEPKSAARKYAELKDEHGRVAELIRSEERRAEQLKEKLREMEDEHAEARAQDLLAEIEPDPMQRQSFIADSAAVRTQMNEASAVAAKLRKRLSENAELLEAAKAEYRAEMANWLDALYRQAIEQYNQIAPNLAAVVLRVAAIRRLMMRRMLGNTNGWNGDILLPQMKWQHGGDLPALLDGAWIDGADSTVIEQLERELHVAGFSHDWK